MPKKTLSWKTDRKDLIERVRVMDVQSTKQLLNPHVGEGLRAMTHEDAANRLMILVLEGAIKETELPS